jgi:hypothetical protein
MWPAALAGGLAVFLGSFGSGPVQTAYAADGDVCAIYALDDEGNIREDDEGNRIDWMREDGSPVIAIGETIDVLAIFEDTGLEPDFSVDVNLDDYTGDAAITSVDDNGDGDTDSINPTNHLNSMETSNVFEDDCGGDSEFPGLSALVEILADAAEDGENCLVERTPGESPNFMDTVCSDPTPGDDNGGGDDDNVPYNDFDIDCATDEIATACEVQASAADFELAAAVIFAGLEAGDDCEDIGEEVNDELVESGTNEFIAFQFGDFVEDACLDEDEDGDNIFTDIDLEDVGDDSELWST